MTTCKTSLRARVLPFGQRRANHESNRRSDVRLSSGQNTATDMLLLDLGAEDSVQSSDEGVVSRGALCKDIAAGSKVERVQNTFHLKTATGRVV